MGWVFSPALHANTRGVRRRVRKEGEGSYFGRFFCVGGVRHNYGESSEGVGGTFGRLTLFNIWIRMATRELLFRCGELATGWDLCALSIV